MVYVPEKLRAFVVERAGDMCEYCKAPSGPIVGALQADHILPSSLGGTTHQDNLCLACIHCNGHKHAAVSAVDPQTSMTSALFNPRIHRWHDHFRWRDDGLAIIGETQIGRVTVARLRMNAPRLLEARRWWQMGGWRPHEME